MNQVLEELTVKIHYDVDKASVNNYLAAQKKVNKGLMKSTTLLRGLGKFVGALGISVGAVSMFNTYKKLDLVRTGIEGLTKSTQDWQYVQDEAFRTATNLEVVARGYRNFFAAANMAGFSKDDIQGMYSDVLTSARAIGATEQQTEGALLALEQMISKGVVSMEELRRQLGNALPGAFEVGAKAMNMTTQEFNKLVKTGKLLSADFVPKFVKAYKEEFGGGFTNAIQSVDAATKRLSISWQQLIMTIGDSGLGKATAGIINDLADFLRSPTVVATANALGKALGLVGQMLRLVTKNLKFILIIFGVSQLSKVPALMKMISMSVHSLTLQIVTGAKNLGLLNKVVMSLNLLLGKQLIPTIKMLGNAGFVAGKKFLWLITIVGVLYSIYLLFSDIYMYLTDPDAITVTGALAEKSESIRESLESIKNTFIDIKPHLETLLPMIAQFLEIFLPFMAKMTEWGLWLGINFLDDVLGIVRAFTDWGDKTVTLKDRLQDLVKFLYAVIGVIGGAIAGFMMTGGNPLGAIIGGVLGGATGVGLGKFQDWNDKKFKQSAQDFAALIHPKATQADINKQLRFDGLPTTSNMTMIPSNLTKTETQNTTVYSNPVFNINAQNKTDEEMIGLFKSALNGDLDNINRQINQGVYSSPVKQGG